MPTKSSKGKAGPAALGAAGAIPLALALTVGNLSPGGGSKVVTSDPNAAVKCEEGIENFSGCHPSYPTGCSPSGKYDGYLNFLKNQEPARNSTPVKLFTSAADYQNLNSRTPSTLGPSNHFDLKDDLATLGEGQEYGVIGYLYYVKQEGAESSNCELTAPDDTDFHIGIGFDKNVAASVLHPATETAADKTAVKETTVVVEMTPQYRANLAPEWTIEALKQVLGKQVRAVGQLMADNEHNVPKDNCGLAGHEATCWRASIWELHPLTSFQWCSVDDCTKDATGWIDLGSSSSTSASGTAQDQAPKK
jgi:hypothetical protein